MTINIPAITSFENALQVYYANSEMGNAEITTLFGRRSSAKVSVFVKVGLTNKVIALCVFDDGLSNP